MGLTTDMSKGQESSLDTLRMAQVQINLKKVWNYLFSAFSKYSRAHLNVWENLHNSGFDILPVKTLEICKWVMASKYALISGYAWDFLKCVFTPSVSVILDIQWSYYASILSLCELALMCNKALLKLSVMLEEKGPFPNHSMKTVFSQY